MGMFMPDSGMRNIPVGEYKEYNPEEARKAAKKNANADVNTAEDKSTAEKEVSSYLDKKRGTIGTIATSWQGLLDEDDKKPKRKTLLGE